MQFEDVKGNKVIVLENYNWDFSVEFVEFAKEDN